MLLLVWEIFSLHIIHIVRDGLAHHAVQVGIATHAQRIEDHYDIKTITEVKAFLDGTEPDSIERTRKLPGAVRVALQMAFGAIIGIALMLGIMAIVRFAGLL